MTKLSQQVAEFHRLFNQPVLTTPTVPDAHLARLRMRLVIEEAFELVEACTSTKYTLEDLAALRKDTFSVIDNMRIAVDFPEYADALADLDYVVEGSRLSFGLKGEPIADEVQRSNLAKLGGPIDANGKARKPPGWTPPDIHGELVKQGWVP